MSAKAILTTLLVTTAAVTALACGDEDGPTAPATVACEDIAFTPKSDDMAAEIRATGVTCEEARDFIRSSKGAPGTSHRGYECTSKRRDGETLIHTIWRCAGDGKVIAWKRF